MTTLATQSSARQKIQLSFFFWVTVVMSLFIFGGFGMTYWQPMAMGTGQPLPPIVHLHGFSFSLWMLMLMAQSFLVNVKNVAFHRTIGTFGIALAAVLILSGFTLSVMSAGSSYPDVNLGLMYLSFAAILSFTILFILAIRQVRKPANHKRLILLATIPLLPPGINRLYMMSLDLSGPPFLATYLTMDLFVIAILLNDWRSDGKINKYSIIGAAFILTQQVLHFPITNSDAFMNFCGFMASLSYYR